MHTKLYFFLVLILTSQVNLSLSQGFYDPGSIQEIRILVNISDWDKVLDSLKQSGSEDRIVVSCIINGTRLDSAGMRFKGSSSYNNAVNLGSPKIPLNIKLDEFRWGQNYMGAQTLKLNNVFRDPSFVREVLSYEILKDYMPAPGCNFAKVYINDQYYGLYVNVETIDDVFLQKHFGSADGNFFKCDPDWHAPELQDCPAGEKASLQYLGEDSLCYISKYERKSSLPDDWEQLIRLCRRLKHQPEKLPEILNIEQVIWMHAFNTVLVNLDGYSGRLCHNYYLFRDSTGRFQPLVWDLNMSFGGFQFSGSGNKLKLLDMQRLDPLMHVDQPEWPLIMKILNTDKYRQLYTSCIKTILDDHFLNGAYLQRITFLTNLIREEVKMDTNRFYPYDDFVKNIEHSVPVGNGFVPGLQELMEYRSAYLARHPLLKSLENSGGKSD